jgi:hypothetical protein
MSFECAVSVIFESDDSVSPQFDWLDCVTVASTATFT